MMRSSLIGEEKAMIRKIPVVIALVGMLFCCAGQAGAAFSKSDAGTSTALFLKLGAGARAAGMGEAFTAVTDNADSIYWNPAGINAVAGRSLSVMHAVWFEDIVYDWASYAQNIGKTGVIGVGVQYLSYGSITKTDSTGLENGSISPRDLALTLSYGRRVRTAALGANIKYISSKINNSASAYAVDLGAMCPVGKKLSLGAAVQNIGTKMKFGSEEDALPLNAKVGGVYAFKKNWQVALDVNAPVDNEVFFALGTEYGYRISETMNAAGRLGYNTRAKDTGGMNGIGAGLGFRYMDYTLDYAFVPYGELGNTQRLSFGLNFK